MITKVGLRSKEYLRRQGDIYTGRQYLQFVAVVDEEKREE